jgi:hypothetical protein
MACPWKGEATLPRPVRRFPAYEHVLPGKCGLACAKAAFGVFLCLAGPLAASGGTDAPVGMVWVPGGAGSLGQAGVIPEGPSSTIEAKENHPVVQVSWHDAVIIIGKPVDP